MKRTVRVRWCLVVLMTVSYGAWAFPISSDQQLGGGVLAGDGGGNTITPSAVTDGYLYDWGDVNGDGNRSDPVADAGIDINSNKLWNSDGSQMVLNLNSGTITGASGVVAISTKRGGTGNAGDITITNVGAISMGKIDTEHTSSGEAGDVRVGHAENRAGGIRIDEVHMRQTMGGNNGYRAGCLTVYGSSDVVIGTAAGAPGDIDAHPHRASGGNIFINHDGAFSASNLLSWTPSIYHGGHIGGDITLNGDGLADSPSGDCRIHSLDTHYQYVNYGVRAGDVVIHGYTEVLVAGSINTYSRSSSGSTRAGNVTITNITGDIRIEGTINLNQEVNPSADGTLHLQATAGGRIYVQDLFMTNTLCVKFDSPSGSYIEGIFTNWTGPTDLRLRAPAGQNVYYFYKKNLWTDRERWVLPDLAGNIGQGGKLRPAETAGTVVIFK